MCYLQLQNVSLLHNNGQQQFKSISLSLPTALTGIIGANGIGKSLLAKIMIGQITPSTGTVKTTNRCLYLAQDALDHIDKTRSIADFLAAADKLSALDKVSLGTASERDFDLIGDDWLFKQEFQQTLQKLGNNFHAEKSLSALSGGELTKLLLADLFKQARAGKSLLILDEPSNHLDITAKKWLKDQLQSLTIPCVIVSHDRQLLNSCSHIAELSATGLELRTGNYQHFQQQKKLQQEANLRQHAQLKRDYKNSQQQAQKDREKAQTRAAKGLQTKRDGSQPKLALNAKSEKAQHAKASKMAAHQNKQQQILDRLTPLEQVTKQPAVSFILDNQKHKAKRLIHMATWQHKRIKNPITLTLTQGDKCLVKGNNGAGKSTLLNALAHASQQPESHSSSHSSSHMTVNTKTLLLDQYCSIVRPEMTLLENLYHYCPKLTDSELRGLLASIGFRKDKVFQLASCLSGGEKMRAAMLIASQQNNTLLLLDEPDNHLDIDSKTELASALNQFNGSFMLVSHDEYFVAESGCNKEICI